MGNCIFIPTPTWVAPSVDPEIRFETREVLNETRGENRNTVDDSRRSGGVGSRMLGFLAAALTMATHASPDEKRAAVTQSRSRRTTKRNPRARRCTWGPNAWKRPAHCYDLASS